MVRDPTGRFVSVASPSRYLRMPWNEPPGQKKNLDGEENFVPWSKLVWIWVNVDCWVLRLTPLPPCNICQGHRLQNHPGARQIAVANIIFFGSISLTHWNVDRAIVHNALSDLIPCCCAHTLYTTHLAHVYHCDRSRISEELLRLGVRHCHKISRAKDYL